VSEPLCTPQGSHTRLGLPPGFQQPVASHGFRSGMCTLQQVEYHLLYVHCGPPRRRPVKGSKLPELLAAPDAAGVRQLRRRLLATCTTQGAQFLP
jgi:hypothetical protein